MFKFLRRKDESKKWPLPWTYMPIHIRPKPFVSKKKFVKEVYKAFPESFDTYLFPSIRIFGGRPVYYRTKKQLIAEVDSVTENSDGFYVPLLVGCDRVAELNGAKTFDIVYQGHLYDFEEYDPFLIDLAKKEGATLPKDIEPRVVYRCVDCEQSFDQAGSCPNCGSDDFYTVDTLYRTISDKERRVIINSLLKIEDERGVQISNRHRWVS